MHTVVYDYWTKIFKLKDVYKKYTLLDNIHNFSRPTVNMPKLSMIVHDTAATQGLDVAIF